MLITGFQKLVKMQQKFLIMKHGIIILKLVLE